MPLLNRRHLLQIGLAGSGAMLAASPASALVKIIVTAGDFVPLPIAIPDFASSDPAFGKDVADVVRANLTRSGLFQVIDPASLPQPGRRCLRPARFRLLARHQRRRAGDGAGRAGRTNPVLGARLGHAGGGSGGRQILFDRPEQLAPYRPYRFGRHLSGADGGKRLFRYPHRLCRGERPQGEPGQAAGHHGPGRRQCDLHHQWRLAGPDPALLADPADADLHELRERPAAGLSARHDFGPSASDRQFRTDVVCPKVFARWTVGGLFGRAGRERPIFICCRWAAASRCS